MKDEDAKFLPRTLYRRVTLVLRRAVQGRWTWTKNPRCKYITLRIDTRNGSFVLLDRENVVITIQDLEKQETIKQLPF